ncbi:hypothetical protein B0J13DRAFT_110951 [Dactylonectria estremocensis]|uniref:Uncharacterized protein n=1 Tax=Dactylonectria estremocensis TaxID=1079267 RepID=A0A9P9FD88_9HYPO|nr:hypothetical protein B0J13DRAFT_110951 [Dactylonectria estremocensis]
MNGWDGTRGDAYDRALHVRFMRSGRIFFRVPCLKVIICSITSEWYGRVLVFGGPNIETGRLRHEKRACRQAGFGTAWLVEMAKRSPRFTVQGDSLGSKTFVSFCASHLCLCCHGPLCCASGAGEDEASWEGLSDNTVAVAFERVFYLISRLVLAAVFYLASSHLTTSHGARIAGSRRLKGRWVSGARRFLEAQSDTLRGTRGNSPTWINKVRGSKGIAQVSIIATSISTLLRRGVVQIRGACVFLTWKGIG